MVTKQHIFNLLDFGAVGDGTTNDVSAFERAIEACSKVDDAKLIVPSGKVFVTGPFQLCSNLDFHVEKDATVLAHPDESLYTESAFRDNKGEGSIWIGGKHLQNIIFSGTGTIDGNGVAFMGEELSDAYELKPF